MPKKVTLGGRLSIAVAALWSICVVLLLSGLSFSQYLELPVGLMTFPLGVFGGVGGLFSRRGLIGLDEIITLLILMIPNVFLLGYGLAGIYKALKPSRFEPQSSISYSSFSKKNHKAEQDAP